MTEHPEDQDQDAQIIDFPGSELVEWEGPETDVAVYSPASGVAVYASIIDTPVIGTRAEIMQWLDECRGGIELRWHKAKVHSLRSPLYAGRASRHSLRGLWVALKFWFAWVRDVEMLDIIYRVATDNSIAGNTQQSAHAKARYDRMWRVRRRWAATIAILLSAVLLYRNAWNHHLWLALLIGLAVVVGLGLIGAQRGEVVQFVDLPAGLRLTADAVVTAFVEAEITKPDEKKTNGNLIKVMGIPRKVGNGTAVIVELPPGMTVAAVRNKRVALASALNCSSASLDIDEMKTKSERLLGLFVADIHPEEMVIPAWPLISAQTWDVWQPVPFGMNLRGDVEDITILFTSLLFGSAPRMGKTWSARLIALACALDPKVILDVFDFKGNGDWSMFGPITRSPLVEGPSNESVRALRDFLRDDLWPDVERRAKVLRGLGTVRAPGGKVTRELAADPELGLQIRFVAIDEIAIATEHHEYGPEIIKLLLDIVRLCTAAGVIPLFATQKPDDDSIPGKIRDLVNTRFALRCLSWRASEAVLGTAAKSQGWEAENFSRSQMGTGILLGAGDDAGASVDGAIVKTFLVDGREAEVICLRAAKLRQMTPIASGPVASTSPLGKAKEVPGIVTAALKAWPRPEMNCHQDLLSQRMHMDQVDLGRALRKLDLPAEPVRMKRDDDGPAVRRGYRLVDLEALAR